MAAAGDLLQGHSSSTSGAQARTCIKQPPTPQSLLLNVILILYTDKDSSDLGAAGCDTVVDVKHGQQPCISCRLVQVQAQPILHRLFF
jgi:hypothetical protein